MRLNVGDVLDSLDINADWKSDKPCVKRVKDIFEKPSFFLDGAKGNDVRQGRLGNCWMAAAVSAVTNKSGLIERLCPARNEEVGVYGFVFHRDGEWSTTIVDDHLFLIHDDFSSSKNLNGRRLLEITGKDFDDEDITAEQRYRELYQRGSSALYYGKCQDPNETWFPLLEKAYAKAHGDYSSLQGGSAGDAFEDLTGGVTNTLCPVDILNKHAFWKQLTLVNKELLLCCSSIQKERGLLAPHAYSVVRAVEMYGKRLLLIRNPHGRGEWTGAWSDGSKEWTPEWMLRLDHRFGNDGYFWMSFEDFLERYKEFDRTRLFSDEWNIAQKWTCLDLPYTSEYHKVKFSFTLSKAAPVVISLSEPAKRYFRGLWGPYAVSCSYRLEKVGQGLVIDVGGPLKTARSTSAELNLEAGEYHVLIKTHSYPDDRWPSLESVIRQNVDERPQKLRQVGLRYDQAHSRARLEDEAYEKELAKKARQARKANLVKRLRAKMLTEKRRKKHQENKKRRKLLAAKLKKRAKAKAKLEKDVPATDAAWMGEIDSSKTISKVLKRTTRSATKMSKTENLVVKGESISETVSQATPNVAVEVTTKSGDATVISDIDDDSDINSDVSDISTDEVEEMIEEMRKDAYGKKLFPLEPPKPAALGLLPKDGSVILDWNASVTLGLRVYAQNSEIEMRIIRPEWEDVLGSSEDDRSDGDAIIQHIAREEKKDKSKFESENEKLLEMISY